MSTDTQTETPDGAAILKEMVDGLEGVPGSKWKPIYLRHDVNPSEIWYAEAQRVCFMTSDGPATVAFHIARCAPENIRAIAAHVKALEAENAALRKILTEQTGLASRLCTIVDCMEQDIGCETPDAIWPLLGPVVDRAETLLAALNTEGE